MEESGSCTACLDFACYGQDTMECHSLDEDAWTGNLYVALHILLSHSGVSLAIPQAQLHIAQWPADVALRG